MLDVDIFVLISRLASLQRPNCSHVPSSQNVNIGLYRSNLIISASGVGQCRPVQFSALQCSYEQCIWIHKWCMMFSTEEQRRAPCYADMHISVSPTAPSNKEKLKWVDSGNTNLISNTQKLTLGTQITFERPTWVYVQFVKLMIAI